MSLAKRRSVCVGTTCAWPSAILFALTLLGENQALTAEEDAATDAIKDHVPKPGFFPPAGAGIHLDGDLMTRDPMNRRGGLRNSQPAPRH